MRTYQLFKDFDMNNHKSSIKNRTECQSLWFKVDIDFIVAYKYVRDFQKGYTPDYHKYEVESCMIFVFNKL